MYFLFQDFFGTRETHLESCSQDSVGNKGTEHAERGGGNGKEMSSNTRHYFILIYRSLSQCNGIQFILGGTAPPSGVTLN